MQCSVEIALHPFTAEYVPPVEAFIADLRAHEDLDVDPGDMSTRVHGDYEVVMAALTEAMRRSLGDGRGAFTLKVLGIDARAPHPR